MDPTTGNVFRITYDGSHKTSEKVARGKYGCLREWITDKIFLLQKHLFVNRTIELLSFNYDPTGGEVLNEFRRRGLKQPTHNDALLFQVQYPEEQKKHPIAFLYEPPYQSRDGFRLVFVLRADDSKSGLEVDFFNSKWLQRVVFAAVRPNTKE